MKKEKKFRGLDITGQRFGRLVALYRLPHYGKAHDTMWMCKCDCGTVKPIPLSGLKSGRSRSCGCLRKEVCSARTKDMIGFKTGKLTVISREGSYNNEACWRVRCECGNESVVRGADLRGHRVRSCGCSRRHART